MRKLIELDAALDALGNIDCSDGVGISALKCDAVDDAVTTIKALPTVDAVEVVRCKDCKHNPKLEWFGCPMASLSEKQRPETAWCWKGERKDGKNGKTD